MKVIDRIKQANSTLFSFEVLPPMKGARIESLFDAIDLLQEFNPAFVNVTYHREEYTYEKLPNGLLKKKGLRKRPGTVGICAAIKNKYDIITVPHLICGGFTREETENALIDLNFLGVNNLLVLRGDAIKSEGRFMPQAEGHSFASQLLEQVVSMNKGKYLHPEIKDVAPTDFCLGVAGYPEKHFESPNKQVDLRYLKEKVEKGADYIVTQMFFNNQHFFDFVKECRDVGIKVPIIPGIKPLSRKSQLGLIPRLFHVEIPDELVRQVEACANDAEVREVGIAWGIKQAKELLEHDVPCLHFYTMGKTSAVHTIAKEVF